MRVFGERKEDEATGLEKAIEGYEQTLRQSLTDLVLTQ